MPSRWTCVSSAGLTSRTVSEATLDDPFNRIGLADSRLITGASLLKAA